MRKKEDLVVAIGVNYGVDSICSWSKSICYIETCLPRIREPMTTIASFQRRTP